MREILFRGKRVDNGEWVYGYLIHDSICSTTIPYIGYLSCEQANTEDGDVVAVVPESIGQYTGLTDKSGNNKIFEGDIVEFKDKNYSKSLNYRRIVTFRNGCFLLKNIKTEVHTNFNMYQCEYCVIGNVHDNSGLLEVE